MQLKSIQTKIALLSGLCLLVSAAALVGYGVYSTGTTQAEVSRHVGAILENNAKRNLAALAANQAAVIQSALQDNLDTARTMAKTFEVLQEQYDLQGSIRDVLNSVLLAVLENNPKYLGAYTAWEPNALDDRDAEFATKPGSDHDKTGRFVPYWNRDEAGNIARQALVEFESQDKHPNGIRKGGWYLWPRESGKESVLDPFPYIVQGKTDWLTTLSVPIKKDGKFLGVAGTDLRLGFLQELAKTVDASLYEGKGDVAIISYEGLVVASSEKPDAVGQPMELISKEWKSLLKPLQTGQGFADISAATGSYRALAPVQLGRTDRPWAVLIRLHPDIVLADANALAAEMSAMGRANGLKQLGVGLGVTAVAMLVLWLFARTLARPLRQAAGFAEKVAEGDFSRTLDIQQRDEIGVLANALRTMVGNLKNMINQAEAKTQEAAEEAERARAAVAEAEQARRDAAEAQRKGRLDAAARIEDVVQAVNAASTELTAQVQKSREGAELQRQHAGETATAMEEMNATVLEVAKNAAHAASGSDTAKDKAKEGADVVREVVEAIQAVQEQAVELKRNMDSLGQQAQGIDQIINVISDIADQTNLLALNAAIEAARAGDAGRGFAVVADEVRKLAEKTMTATTEVGQVVRSIQTGAKSNITGVEHAAEAVDRATQLAERSGAVLTEIVTIVEAAADQVRSIATASEEQSAASEEINRSVEGINRISEDTATAMTQANAAVDKLAEQTTTMHQLVAALQQD
ncbi:MAG: methyl-accepting chemotaxis protein [Desulfovibrionaceae bacterium]|nr:methyl-accepting chemotaxis protein [Desulfovibrionaceae bacterium]